MLSHNFNNRLIFYKSVLLQIWFFKFVSILIKLNHKFTNNITFRIIVFLSLFTIFLSNNLYGDFFYFACYALILTFGIIHGANDVLILFNDQSTSKLNIDAI